MKNKKTTQALINEVVNLIGDDTPAEFCEKAGIKPYPPMKPLKRGW